MITAKGDEFRQVSSFLLFVGSSELVCEIID